MPSYVKNGGSSGLKNLPTGRRGYQADQPLTGLLDLSDDLEDMADLGTGSDAVDPIAAALAPKPRKQQTNRTAKPVKKTSSNQKRTQAKSGQTPSQPAAGVASSPKTKPSTAASSRKAPQRLPMRKSKTHDLKATAAPLLATVGVLLLVPAIWAALLLVGVGVPGAARDDARTMAAVMTASWPVAICLIAASLVFFKQIIREKKRLKAAAA